MNNYEIFQEDDKYIIIIHNNIKVLDLYFSIEKTHPDINKKFRSLAFCDQITQELKPGKYIIKIIGDYVINYYENGNESIIYTENTYDKMKHLKTIKINDNHITYIRYIENDESESTHVSKEFIEGYDNKIEIFNLNPEEIKKVLNEIKSELNQYRKEIESFIDIDAIQRL